MFSRFDKTDAFIIGISGVVGVAITLIVPESSSDPIKIASYSIQITASRIFQALSYCFVRHGEYKMAVGTFLLGLAGDAVMQWRERKFQLGGAAQIALKLTGVSCVGTILLAGAMNGVASLGKRVVTHH